jgi:KaiC/GvpD/RAD55 family RecA-like ATPase
MGHEQVRDVFDREAATTSTQLFIDSLDDRIEVIQGASSRHLGRFHPGLIAQHIAELSGRNFVGFDDPGRPWLGSVAIEGKEPSDVGEPQPVRNALKGWFHELDLRFQTADGITGMPTGIPAIDRVGGVAPGELLVLAGAPGSGKTALACSAALVAATSGVPGIYVNLADTSSNLMERMMTISTGVRSHQLRAGELERSDMSELTYAAAALKKLPLATFDGRGAGTTIGALRQIVRSWRAEIPATCPFVIVDYLSMLHGDQLARGLLELARSLSVAVIAVAQLGDVGIERAVREVATSILVLTRPGRDGTRHRLSLVKHRRAALGSEWLLFDPETGSFTRTDENRG